jgi:hypothetical protein
VSDTPPSSSSGSHFCGECGASVDAGATFCGECGAATSAATAAAAGAAAVGGDATDKGGASKWDGVETVVDRGDKAPSGSLPPPTAPPVTVPVPNVPPPPAPATQAGPVVPPPGAPGAPGPGGPGGPGDGTPDGKKGNGPKILIGALVVLALLAGAFFFLGGDDDDGGEEGGDTTFQRDDDEDPDDDDDETTTTDAGDTTTTEADGTTVDAGFVNLVDETGRLTVDVPADWTDVILAPDEGLPRILAATDANAFETGFSEPGLDLRLLSANLAPEQFDSSLDTVANTIGLPNSCTSQGKQDYTDGVFTGRMEVWGECAGVGTSMALLFANQADGQTIFLGLQLTAEDDPAIADEISGSFLIVG